MNASIILGEDGAGHTINGSLVDISPEKRIAQQLDQERALLAQRIKEHTEAIARANDMALQASLQRRWLVSTACADISARLERIWAAQTPTSGPLAHDAIAIQMMLRALTLMTAQERTQSSEEAGESVLASCARLCEPLAASVGVTLQYRPASSGQGRLVRARQSLP